MSSLLLAHAALAVCEPGYRNPISTGFSKRDELTEILERARDSVKSCIDCISAGEAVSASLESTVNEAFGAVIKGASYPAQSSGPGAPPREFIAGGSTKQEVEEYANALADAIAEKVADTDDGLSDPHQAAERITEPFIHLTRRDDGGKLERVALMEAGGLYVGRVMAARLLFNRSIRLHSLR